MKTYQASPGLKRVTVDQSQQTAVEAVQMTSGDPRSGEHRSTFSSEALQQPHP